MAESIDRAIVAELKALMGDEFEALLEAFREDSSQRLVAARQAWAGGDRSALHRQIHSLKGAAANIGAEVLAARCEALVSLAGAGARADIAAALAAVEQALDACHAALEGPPYRD